ncbi:MAG: DUF5916 domain-containing protein [bacterium]
MHFVSRFIVLCLAVVIVFPAEAFSDTVKQVRAIRLTAPVVIDGKLSEAVWKNGKGVSSFRQRDPNQGTEPSQQTIVWVAYDDDAIYVGARMYDTAPDSIIARLGRRDSYLKSDYFQFMVDPYYDRRSGFFFSLYAGGTRSDGILFNDDWDDDSWDGVWDGKVNIDDEGWTAEMRIPFSQLRFHKKDEYLWGVNFRRDISRKNERDYLVYTPRDESGFVSRFVDLVGIENIDPARQIELLPYIRTKGEFTHPAADNPFNDGSRYRPDIGGDLKIGIGNNLTLDATVNPDFGQVEVDPAVVNLSDVETFFSERRPFFIEGSTTFNFGSGGSNNFWGFNWGSPDFFYSRRIGRAPQGEMPDYDYADVPDGTTILGAGKLTGKVGNNINMGTILAVTARENADLELNENRSIAEVEPLTYYGIFRAQKEIDNGRHALGVISTLTKRQFKDDRLRDDLNSSAFTGGIDGWTFLDKDKMWVVTGWAGFTNIRANETRMLAMQRSSRHYFQRPDAGHVSVDSSRTSLSGYAARVMVNKQKGNWTFNGAFGLIDPGFDVNDVGFMWRTDMINTHAVGGYRWTDPGKFYRSIRLNFATFRTYDFDGNNTGQGYFHFGYFQFLNYYSINWSMSYNPETITNSRTRGGPLSLRLPSWFASAWLSSDSRKAWVFGLGSFGGRGESGFREWGADADIEWKPASNISLNISPGFFKTHEPAQWVEAFDDPLATETFGRRYVFGALDQKSFSANIRLNWTFTPHLSFQLYAQPLISSGDYREFKELARPKSYDFNVFGEGNSTFSEETHIADPDGPGPAEPIEIENPDFNIKSLRGNAVLRWEYSPGATLFLVWTQSRSEFADIGEFRFRRSFNRLLDIRADNIFMIKATYWLGL